jgi:DNA-binding transcriptional MerR regulator|tara:strand:+ start:992 stop:1396 length:405 start_codon:yes stop_codon:yes gene_type:complete
MKSYNKKDTAYKTIGEVAKELNLVDKKTGHLQTHTIRYWETQFRQIKPSIGAGRRRYYSVMDLKIIKYIKFLLKEKGLTISGVKKILNDAKSDYLDDDINLSVYKPGSKSTKVIKDKIRNISKIIDELKNLKNG